MKQPKIEDGIPIPAPKGGEGNDSATLRKLKIGQSFLVLRKRQNSIHTTARFVFGAKGHIATRAACGSGGLSSSTEVPRKE